MYSAGINPIFSNGSHKLFNDLLPKSIMPHISEHLEGYDLELARVIDIINREKVKTVVLQLPDGLKPHAQQIMREIEAKTPATPVIWGGSCWGSCDVPDVKGLGADLLIQWGHSEWSY